NRNNYLKVFDKYNTTLSNLKEYEDILNQYRVSNHENKNQLLTIRNMVKNKEKNITDYIDKIVENQLKDNEHLMGQTTVIPEGGLRGLVYSKMLLMKEQNIDFDLSVDKAIRTVQLIGLGDNTVLDICKIIGVFLDNAIEAVSSLNEKFIDLEMSIENKKLYISVSNNYEGTIPMEEIENHGYTTKGEGHGYGLSLVKKLVDENPLLKNEKGVSSEEFMQRLIVDVSKLK
ncbi:MAG: GHKL domain-containing protein, partial [Bacilli bacterium]|nr:GHKL domain-containing protein [Bacilli bacterium]